MDTTPKTLHNSGIKTEEYGKRIITQKELHILNTVYSYFIKQWEESDIATSDFTERQLLDASVVINSLIAHYNAQCKSSGQKLS